VAPLHQVGALLAVGYACLIAWEVTGGGVRTLLLCAGLLGVTIALTGGAPLRGWRARREGGRGERGVIEIRDALNGEVLLTVPGSTLAGAELSGLNLGWANLRAADLRSASLRGASLPGVDLEDADLEGADLHGANLAHANLERANLERADLAGADLRSGNLQGASLRGADLRGADLRGAGSHLHANLHRADLTGARYDTYTRWPRGFKPARRGCVGPPAEVMPALAPEGRGTEPASGGM
jgi:hypothetical protein